MPLAKPKFQKESAEASPFPDAYLHLQENSPKSAVIFLCMLNEQLDKLASLGSDTDLCKAEKITLNTLIDHLIRLLELPAITDIKELNKKIERLILEVSFRKKHLWQFEQLTPREKEVLGLLAQGYSNKAIAQRLKICIATAQYYRKTIKSKLTASSTAELVRYGLAFNLI